VDSHNLFLTPVTARLMRLEYLAGLVVAVVLAVLHLGDIRWPVFVLLFAYIDVIGYFPGHLAWRRAGGATGTGVISRRYYVLYNSMHSLVSAGVVAGAWCVLVRPEWALLALPLHLFGDRSLFGNFLKPFGLAFEPRTHSAYILLRSSYELDTTGDASAVRLPSQAVDSRFG
jgi:hypothetical protein